MTTPETPVPTSPTASPAASRSAAPAGPLGPGVVVAVDGPSGSGKSSVSRQAAARRGLAYLDTGAMYRALAWWCRDRGIDLADHDAVARAARELPLTQGTDPLAPTVVVDGRDIETQIRESSISAIVSQVATNLAVRAELIRRQRSVIEEASRHAGIVAEGRDITTVVAPDADTRVLLVASEEARLRRRAAQLHGTVTSAGVEATRDEVVRRDRDDATVAQFQQAAPGVTLLDSSDLTFEETIATLVALIPATTGR